MLPPMARLYSVAILLASLTIASGCNQALATQPVDSAQPAGNANCLSSAYSAAETSFGPQFKGDWYVISRTVVKNGRISTVSINVGPYDGSAGGGIATIYDCGTRKLKAVEFER